MDIEKLYQDVWAQVFARVWTNLLPSVSMDSKKGLLSASGPNLKTALANLEAEVLALVSSEAARSALAAERQKAMPAAPTPAKAPAPYAEGEMVEVLIQGIWCEAEFLNSSPGGSLYAIWSERCGSLVVPKERVRAVNRPSLGDVG